MECCKNKTDIKHVAYINTLQVEEEKLKKEIDTIKKLRSLNKKGKKEEASSLQEAAEPPKAEAKVAKAAAKEEAKVDFQTSKEVRVLISSDAGGYGVDLPQANLLVNYDLPWSSGAAVQRNSRIRRTSSTWKTVIIQDFLALNSIEERQHEMLHQKNSVADAVIDGTGINSRGGVDLTVGSLLNFLTEKQI
jgi:hypothetical protein